MIRFARLAALLALLIATPLTAETLTIPGQQVGYGIPSNFVIRAAGVDFDDTSAFIWVDAEGNCRWDYKQVCWTDPQGNYKCRTEREWVCQKASDYHRLPQTISVDTDAKRAYYTDEAGGTPVTIGKVKSFLWNKWIKLYEGASLDVGYTSASLILDTDVLSGSLKKNNFQELYDAPETD